MFNNGAIKRILALVVMLLRVTTTSMFCSSCTYTTVMAASGKN